MGAIMLEPRELANVLPLLPDESWFSSLKFAAVYRHAAKLWNETNQIDIVGLKRSLDDAGIIDDIGGVQALLDLPTAVPDASNAAYYAGIVREKATVRRVMDVCGRAMQMGFDRATHTEILEAINREITSLTIGSGKQEPTNIGDMMQALYTDLNNREHNSHNGLMTGFHKLDTILGGLQPGQLIVIAGRPAMGKSLAAANIAENAAMNGIGSMIFSLEMSRQELSMRFACSLAGVSMDAVRMNAMGADNFQRLAVQVARVSDWPLMVDDSPSATAFTIKATARRVAQRHPIKLIVVDYLQLMSGPGDSRQEVVAAISRELKMLAKELGIPVIAISQLNRGLEGREEKRPRMSDLRESGAIEQDADVILFLHRPYYYLTDAEKMKSDHLERLAEIIVAKQRNGPTGTVEVEFDGTHQRFRDQGAL